MADNEVILEKDVSRIAALRLVPSLRGSWHVFYEVVFADGRVQQRPLSACACPNAIAAFEGRYFALAHRDGQPGMRLAESDDAGAKSESIAESHSSHEDEDDRHLNDMPSDDSYWDDIVDSQGRSARSPTGSHNYRPKSSARAEDNAATTSSTGPAKAEKKFGVVGSLFADYFDSQTHNKRAALPAKRVKAEPLSDNDGANNVPLTTVQRKRRLGQQDAMGRSDRAIEVVTLTDDEDEVPHHPAKKAKKDNDIVYVLSSDTDDDHDASKP